MFRSASTEDRTVRAMSGVKMKPMTMISVTVDGLSATMNRNAMMTAGSASTASTSRPTIRSKGPPKQRMARPSAVPRTAPRMGASGVMNRMSRAPTRTRDSASRPSGSVPNQWAPDGPALAASNCWASGLYGAIAWPNSAQKIQNKMMTAPTMNVGLRSSSDQRVCTRLVGAETATMSPDADPSGPASPGSVVMSVIGTPDPQSRVEPDQQQVGDQRSQRVEDADAQPPRL